MCTLGNRQPLDYDNGRLDLMTGLIKELSGKKVVGPILKRAGEKKNSSVREVACKSRRLRRSLES